MVSAGGFCKPARLKGLRGQWEMSMKTKYVNPMVHDRRGLRAMAKIR
jgi:hypothetical protein